MADPIIAALPGRSEVAVGLPSAADTVASLPTAGIAAALPAVADVAVARPMVPVLVMPSGTVAMLPIRFGVQFTSAGTFVVAAVAVHVAAVQFAADADLEALALEVQARAAEFSGAGTFIASDIPRRFVEFSGAGAFEAVGFESYSATAEFVAVGGLVVVDAFQVQARSAQFSGVGSLSAIGRQVQARGVEFAGSGSLGVSGIKVVSASVEFSGVGGFDAVATLGASYTDTFNRANGAIGSNWGPSSPQPAINTNAAQNSTTSGNTPQIVEYLGGVMASNHYAVHVTVKTPVGTDRSTGTYFYVTARGTGTATQNDDRVVLVLSGGALSGRGIYTLSSSGTFTSRLSLTSTTFATGDTATLEVNGNVYTAYKNGVSLGSWPDSGGIVPTDPGHRGFGFGTQPYNSGYGFAIDEINAEDL